MANFSIVLFDADGVLLDSLVSHLKICEDLSRKYGLRLSIPSAGDFKEMVRRNVPISPMKYFFKALGFPEEYIERAIGEYTDTFMRDYAPKPFPGISQMLAELSAAGITLGIVTANVRANVESALGEAMRFFCTGCLLSKEDMPDGSKAVAIRSLVKQLDVDPRDVLYVGDLPSDREAAVKAGVEFLGVGYGWGISVEDTGFAVAASAGEIADYVLG